MCRLILYQALLSPEQFHHGHNTFREIMIHQTPLMHALFEDSGADITGLMVPCDTVNQIDISSRVDAGIETRHRIQYGSPKHHHARCRDVVAAQQRKVMIISSIWRGYSLGEAQCRTLCVR